MHTESLDQWTHTHTFGNEKKRHAERMTWIVIVITALTMVAEITAGWIWGSMALLADGLHMGSHTLALSISAFAYLYTRKQAHNRKFSFGTGKVNTLAGYSSALLLLLFALFMIVESADRFIHPKTIHFDQALIVAVVGLIVNLGSVLILSRSGSHTHHQAEHGHRDHNLKAAYLHVLADTLTSVLAIAALLSGKWMGWIWMDPAIGILGGLMIGRWAVSLIRETMGVLLDHQASDEILQAVREAIEKDSTDRITDLHIWPVGTDRYAANLSVITDHPQSPDVYKARLSDTYPFVHLTLEVIPCPTSEKCRAAER